MSHRFFRLGSFNALHGRCLEDGQVSPSRLADACASLDTDVLCLQEVDRGQGRSQGIDQTAAVAERVGTPHWRFEPALLGKPGAEWKAAEDHDGGGCSDEAGYGVGLVSRLPVRSWHVVRLAASRVRAPVAVPGGRGRFLLLPDEPRIGLAALVDAPGGALVVVSTHLSFVPLWNARQLWRLLRAVEGLAPAAVVAGDFNLPGVAVRRLAAAARWRPLVRAATFPAGRPNLQIDHVLGHGPLPAVLSSATRRLPLSDHLAVVVDFSGT